MYIVVIALALAPQILFTVLYWKWIPSWVKNPYGRLAQLDCWSQIALLSLLLVFLIVGQGMSIEAKRGFMALCLIPFIVLGVFRLILLKRAVDSSREEERSNDR